MRPLLDEAWYVDMDEDTRLRWLIARHVEFGKTPEEAEAWVMRSDQANAAVVAATRDRADVIVRLRALRPPSSCGSARALPELPREAAPATPRR